VKGTISAIADWVLVVMTILIGALAAYNFVMPRTTPASPSPIEVGKIAPSIPGIRYSDTSLTVILAVSSGCRYCTNSMAFYRSLPEAIRTKEREVQLVAMGVESSPRVRECLVHNGVIPDVVVNGREAQLPLRGTPTLILIERSGRVLISLQGLLTGEQETHVIESVLHAH
jgi:hypothetical protein